MLDDSSGVDNLKQPESFPGVAFLSRQALPVQDNREGLAPDLKRASALFDVFDFRLGRSSGCLARLRRARYRSFSLQRCGLGRRRWGWCGNGHSVRGGLLRSGGRRHLLASHEKARE